MKARARIRVYRPGIDKPLCNYLNTCHYCHTTSPFQPWEPMVLSLPPSWPHDHVAVDYFDYVGKSYLVYVYRFSGNLHIFHFLPGKADAHPLILSCRSLFLQYVAPRELASDGGPSLAPKDFHDFLNHWGIHHQLSSTYYLQ